MAKKEQMVPAELEPRDHDMHLTSEQLLQLPFFAQLTRKPSLDKFPGAVVVRRFRKGDIVCEQGEAGWTAFYILPREDTLTVCRKQLEAAGPAAPRALRAEVERLAAEVEGLKGVPSEDDRRNAAIVFLNVAPQAADQAIPIDGPVTLSGSNLRAPLREGELFGEMSCLYRSPRSATVVAVRDCYVVELLRNIFDQVIKDPKYKARADEIYKRRVLDLHLRRLPLFEGLSGAELDELRKGVELVSFEPGTLICDEHERSDSFYMVRSGLVKVMKNVSALLHPSDVLDWPGLCARLREGSLPSAHEARAKLWQMLPAAVQALLRGEAASPLDERQYAEVVHALNDILREPKLADAPQFKAPADSPAVREPCAAILQRRQELQKKKADWHAPDARRFNRALLEALLPGALRHRPPDGGPEWVLSYQGRGDYFGETGLLLNRPRGATCVAYGHPNDEGLVELVKVSGELFTRLLGSPAVRDRVEREAQRRRAETVQGMSRPAWDDSRRSRRFEELGLIQGQRLMLIDLDRCTRCDECVQACVATHEDGRTRLFLDGPRFGNYLVPTTCRSCLDPVCMIGCPVGSIHRGDNRQIVIESWCIGCGLCADNCPYGSIQMHDLGLLPEDARGWRFLPAAAVAGDAWLRPGFKDAGWETGEAPFYLDRHTRDQLAARSPAGPAAQGPINFRREFALPPGMPEPESQFRIELTSLAPSVRLWVNGHELTSDDKPKRDGRREYSLPQRAQEGAAPLRVTELLGRGRNVLAVQVTPTAKPSDILLKVRLDEVRRPELPPEVGEEAAREVTQKMVTEQAVVCDLCSTLSRQKPACVQACPHDAAMRVDARSDFPGG
jgi:Fe-S-cluster-containing hydrogenase component 2